MKKMYQDTISDTVSKRRQSKELGSTLARVITELPLKRRHLRTKLQDGGKKATVGRIFPTVSQVLKGILALTDFILLC